MFDSMLQKPFNVSVPYLTQGRIEWHDLSECRNQYRDISSIVALNVKPSLEKLGQDADQDVQYFANEALESKFVFLLFVFLFLIYCRYHHCIFYSSKKYRVHATYITDEHRKVSYFEVTKKRVK
jgi:hypothetical protein